MKPTVVPLGVAPKRKTTGELDFQTEHARLLRALSDSKDRETEMLLQLRRMKETLVLATLKLQVASKVNQEDEVLISDLRKDAADAKKMCAIALRKEEEASQLIESLRVEISSLKRQVREKTDEASVLFASSSAALSVSDAEVDQLMSKMTRPLSQSNLFAKTTGSLQRLPSRELTPFQDWKLQHFIWSPDVPSQETFGLEKQRYIQGFEEDPAAVSDLLDNAFSEIPMRAPSQPTPTRFGQVISRSRSGKQGSLAPSSGRRTTTASGRRPKLTEEPTASPLEMISAKFPGISSIRQRVSSAAPMSRGELSHRNSDERLL